MTSKPASNHSRIEDSWSFVTKKEIEDKLDELWDFITSDASEDTKSVIKPDFVWLTSAVVDYVALGSNSRLYVEWAFQVFEQDLSTFLGRSDIDLSLEKLELFRKFFTSIGSFSLELSRCLHTLSLIERGTIGRQLQIFTQLEENYKNKTKNQAFEKVYAYYETVKSGEHSDSPQIQQRLSHVEERLAKMETQLLLDSLL